MLTVERRNRTVIDGSGLILGRMASIVAKRLLQGETIDIVNSEAIVVSGRRDKIIEDAKEFLNVKGPRWGPIHYRKPSMMVKKTIRGMLPYKSSHGREAYKRLKVHLGVPPEFINVSKETIDEAKAERLGGGYVTIKKIAESIGWRRGGGT
ncbi:MAG: 50S ribosomal protein L13 [Candidatus Bathyarchaeia archaeon]